MSQSITSWAEARARRRQQDEQAAQRFTSGTRQYLPEVDRAVIEAEREVMARPGGWESLFDGEWDLLVGQHQARQQRQLAAAGFDRSPGWVVPTHLRSQWPIYETEAVTFSTEWGLVTVGRSLARIYDLDGWPDAVTLETMARQQAAREAVPA